MSRGGAEREGDTESEARSRLQAVSTEPDAGLKLTNCKIMTWVEVRCLTDWAIQVSLYRTISFFFFNVYSFLRGRAWAGEGQRERETQNPKQAPGSELSAQSLMRGSNSRTWDHDLSRSQTLNRPSHPGAPWLVLKNHICNLNLHYSSVK